MNNDQEPGTDRGFFCDSGLCDLVFALVITFACFVLVMVIPSPMTP